ncbi:hypothetical protein [Actinoplanes subglobosus]|uniref:Uncharacterized protein n=1 Tax=Actinoplanes subglobosus TaxID=1547892 RepID=A0ABV8IZV9_9ACTN
MRQSANQKDGFADKIKSFRRYGTRRPRQQVGPVGSGVEPEPVTALHALNHPQRMEHLYECLRVGVGVLTLTRPDGESAIPALHCVSSPA